VAKASPRRRKASKVLKADPVEALVVANAAALGISLEAGWRKGVIFNFGLIMRQAALVDEFPLSDDAEPAPVYRA
jgi:hypothetical protein